MFMLLRKPADDKDPPRYYAWTENERPHYSTVHFAAKFSLEDANKVVRHLSLLGHPPPDVVPAR